MKKIIIFKTDRIGDFVYFSPCLKNLKDNFKNNCEITVICGKYNYQIVKNYKEIDKIICFKNNYFLDFFYLFKKTISNKYDYLFQFDGINKSYFFSLFIRSKIKSTIFFNKKSKFVNINYNRIRPTYFLRKIFNNFLICNQDYNIKNENSHYQTNYFNILKKIDINVTSKENLFYLDQSYLISFNKIIKSFSNDYYLFHIDEKSNRLDEKNFNNFVNLIISKSMNLNILITFGLGKIKHEKILKNNFMILDFNDPNLFNNSFKNKILAIKNLPLNLLAYFIMKSKANISMHSGSIVHISAAFNVPIIDILEKEKNNEVDRWVPSVSNYKRVNFETIDDNNIKNFSI